MSTNPDNRSKAAGALMEAATWYTFAARGYLDGDYANVPRYIGYAQAAVDEFHGHHHAAEVART